MNLLPDNYIETITKLKSQIKQARVKAALKANEVLLELYWEIGQTILLMQQQEGWGAKVIERVAVDLKTDFPDFKGLSVRNLKYMVAYAKAFPLLGQQAAAQLQSTDNHGFKFVQQPAAQLPWGHIQVLLDKVSDSAEMLNFYVQKCAENGWSRVILVAQIKSDLYGRQGAAITNFSQTLPGEMSDLAQQTLKNPYLFDFLSLGEKAQERDLENALTEHLKQFMLELGRGFAYVGRQKNLVVNGDDFFLDLLFYNYHLHCFVVFELKIGDFKPEFAGKLNFYVNAINEQLKGIGDKPTIGVLLCKTPNETVVKYSLQGIESPIGVAEYQLSEALPKQLKGELPSIEELENEIDKSYEELKSPQQLQFEKLKQKLRELDHKPIEAEYSGEIWQNIVNRDMIPLFKYIIEQLEDYKSLFFQHDYYWSGNNNITDINKVSIEWATKKPQSMGQSLYFNYNLWGLKESGTDAWNCFSQLHVHLDRFWYGFSLDASRTNFICKKLYSDALGEDDNVNIVNALREALNGIIEAYIKTQFR